MEIKGRIIHVLPLQEGVSKAGNPWKKQEYVLETEEQYPRKVCFNLFGDKVDQYPAAIGEDVVVSFDLESREFNGRWYTDVRAWKIEKSASVAQGVPDMPPLLLLPMICHSNGIKYSRWKSRICCRGGSSFIRD